MDLIFRLGKVSIFETLGADDLLRVAGISEERTFSAHERVCQKGAECDYLYIITSGRLGMDLAAPTERFFCVGDCVGQLALFDGAAYAATIVAMEVTGVIATPRQGLQELLELYPTIARAMAGVLIARIRQAMQSSS